MADSGSLGGMVVREANIDSSVKIGTFERGPRASKFPPRIEEREPYEGFLFQSLSWGR